MDFKTIFLDHFQKCLNEDSGIEIAALRDIASGNNASAANAALKELMQEGIVTSMPEVDAEKINMPISECNKFKLTEKGIDFIKQRSAGYEQKNKFSYIDAYLKTYKNAMKNFPRETVNRAVMTSELVKHFQPALEQYRSMLSSIPWDTINNAKALSDLQAHMPRLDTSQLDIQFSFTPEQIQQITNTYASISEIVKSQYNGKGKKALSSFLDEVDKAQKEIAGSEEVPNIKAAASGEENTKTFTFEGILGQNCGNVVEPLPEDEKRIQVKGFKVNDGLRVLRGFAKSSDLAAISQADENYQRDKYPKHVVALSDFIQNIKTSAKYLPEVTLVARGYKKLNRITLSGQLSPTQQGELDNLEYFRLTVNEKQLYRVDGNHRLEALQDSDYYIPFAIIIWEESKVNQDDEAFLFYFLNAKAKKLTTEENLKGLLQATTWKEDELKKANFYIPHLKFLQEILDDPLLEHKFSKNDNPIKSIAELLEKIHCDDEPVKLDLFKSAASIMKQLLQDDEWIALRKFHFYHKLLFYIAFKTGNFEKTKNVLGNLENWVSKYQFGNETFDDPILLYNNAERTNHLNPINVFVAMPYYDEGSIDDFNDQIKTLEKELIEKYPVLSNRLNFYEIMRHRGYEIDIQQQIMDQIKSSHIFIADISTHECEKSGKRMNSHANPNVMYELGFAKNQSHTEIILLKNKNDEIDVPSDLITKYHNKYEKDKKYLMRKKLFEAIEGILKEKFDII